MATGSVFVKMIIVYFCINLFLFAGGFRLDNQQVFTDLVTSNSSEPITSTNNQYTLSSNLTGNKPNVDVQTSPGSIGISFIDVLRSTSGFINFIGVMLVGLPLLFITFFPPVIQLFIGTILTLMALIGLIMFVRSGQ